MRHITDLLNNHASKQIAMNPKNPANVDHPSGIFHIAPPAVFHIDPLPMTASSTDKPAGFVRGAFNNLFGRSADNG